MAVHWFATGEILAQTAFARQYRATVDTPFTTLGISDVGLRPDGDIYLLESIGPVSYDSSVVTLDHLTTGGEPMAHHRYRFDEALVFAYHVARPVEGGMLCLGTHNGLPLAFHMADNGTVLSALVTDDPGTSLAGSWYDAIAISDDTLMLVGNDGSSHALFGKCDAYGSMSTCHELLVDGLYSSFNGALALSNGDVLAWGTIGTFLNGIFTTYTNIARIEPEGAVQWAMRMQEAPGSITDARGAREMADGSLRIATAYKGPSDATARPALLALQADGNPLWWRSYPEIALGSLFDAVPMGDDQLALAFWGSDVDVTCSLLLDGEGAIVGGTRMDLPLRVRAACEECSGAPLLAGFVYTTDLENIPTVVQGSDAITACGAVPLVSNIVDLTPIIASNWSIETIDVSSTDIASSITHGTYGLESVIACTGIPTSLNDAARDPIMTWPVPANENVWADLPMGELPLAVEVVDALGRAHAVDWQPTGRGVELRIGALVRGIHVLRITTALGPLLTRMIKD